VPFVQLALKLLDIAGLPVGYPVSQILRPAGKAGKAGKSWENGGSTSAISCLVACFVHL